jgi:hypothetical protein
MPGPATGGPFVVSAGQSAFWLLGRPVHRYGPMIVVTFVALQP